MKRLVILLAAVALGLAACGSATLPSAGGPYDRATTSAPRSSGPTASPADPKAKPKTDKAHRAASEPKACEPMRGGIEDSLATLVDVRIGTHDGYDRVTFEFGPPSDAQYFGLPRYELVPATPPITEDGSGDPVSMDGSRYAVIVFHGASGIDMTADEYTVTYSGPHDFRPGYIGLAEARQTGDYEATLSWAFGLNRASCWSVHVLQDPMRVTIDFPHD